MTFDRRVVPAFIPPDQRAAILAKQGVPHAVATALLDMYLGISAGRISHDERAEELRGTISLTSAVQRIVSTLDGAATSRESLRDALCLL